MKETTPSFDDALVRFREFLRSQGRSGTVRWIFPEEVVFLRRKLYLRPRPDGEALKVVRSCYERAQYLNAPMEIASLGDDGRVTYAFLFVASSCEEATNNNMESGVKFSLSNSPLSLRLVASGFLWKLLWSLRGAGSKYVGFLFHRHVGLVTKEVP
jgi:hypothetical protein